MTSTKTPIKNPIFSLPKFKDKTLEQIRQDINDNWYKYGHCKVCGKKIRNKLLYDHHMKRSESGICCKSCQEMYNLQQYGCCEHVRWVPTFAYMAETNCPIHGHHTFGTSD